MAVGAALTLLFTLAWALPPGADYAIYEAIVDQVLQGVQLYSAGTRYYDAPWLLAILVPLTQLPQPLAQAILGTASVLMAIGAVHMLRQSRRATLWALVFGLANLHTFSLLFRGQIDALVLLGVGLGWFAVSRRRPWLLSVALWLLSTKPPNVLLVMLLLLWAIRHWPWQDWLRAFSLVGVSMLCSFIAFGLDWPLRYVLYIRETPPGLVNVVATIWRGATTLAIPLWLPLGLALLCLVVWVYWVMRTGFHLGTLALALAINFVFSPYVLGYHFIVLLPALVYVAQADARLALAASLCTWTPLARQWGGFEIAWIDVTYPLALLVATWIVLLRAYPAAARNLRSSASRA